MANPSNPGDELVDVVDDAGNTIRVVTRREMRAGRLPHRCVYVLVFDTRGNLFIHLRTPTKDIWPGRWDICIGGVLAAGETFDVGVGREVREELGIDVPVEPLWPFRYGAEIHGMVYRGVSEGPFRLQVEEIVRGEFVLPEEVLARAQREPFCPDGVLVLERYLDSIRDR
jgi:isopentenyldiphosphate isomerase